ncbi:MAG: response regulator [Terriglobia bacterium]
MRILVADDHEMVRRGVIRLLKSEANWSLCGEAADGSEALLKAQTLRPDLVLMDISMPGLTGLETASLIRQAVPETKVLIMSQNDPARMLPACLEAGAEGCIDKGRLFVELVKTIKEIESQSVGGRGGP